ncbi:unnamed protein product [Rotaria sp. Silwood1]|nr:unnamed protein product [Rotaria sp. Silwood1]CAF0934272.1 unnamed protein product [Rotaria sp. Silwood1]CAF3672177.1 unnamed protein product [Rotaria sp. Silwood1]CAF4763906.1 unnamed protein product [Rotaria sp. Silwood1]
MIRRCTSIGLIAILFLATVTADPSITTTTAISTDTTASTMTASTTATSTTASSTNTATTTTSPSDLTSEITTTSTSTSPSRKFDGLSFMGGIILTVGLGAIAFLVLRYLRRNNRLPYSDLR